MAVTIEGKRVAIVGTGIAGLSLGYMLGRSGWHVTLLEKQDHVGMDAHAVTAEQNDGTFIRISTPPRSFSRTYYPNLISLYKEAHVQTESWSWAWVAFFSGSYNPFVRMGKRRILGYSLPTYFDIRRPLETLTIWWDGYRFTRAVKRDISSPSLSKLTLREYLEHLEISDTFIYLGLLPTLSMVCTCSYEACLNYPVVLVMEFFVKTATFGQYRLKNGTFDAVEKLTSPVERILLSSEIQCIRKSSASKSPVVVYKHLGEIIEDEYDHVIVSTQANHAAQLVQDLTPAESSILNSFPHEKSVVAIHRDPRVMPGNKCMWSPMSIAVAGSRSDWCGLSGSMFTIWANDSFPTLKDDLFQTWNPIIDIDKKDLAAPLFEFERPIMTHDALASVLELRKLQGEGGIWYCGAWNAYRIPLQESGVASALDVFQRMNGCLPAFGSWEVGKKVEVKQQSSWTCLIAIVSIITSLGVLSRQQRLI